MGEYYRTAPVFILNKGRLDNTMDYGIHEDRVSEFMEIFYDYVNKNRLGEISYEKPYIFPSVKSYTLTSQEIYEYNKAHYTKDVCIYEVGKGFWKKDGVYGEDKKLCALMTGEYYLGLGMKKAVDFYIIKGVAEEVLDYLGYGNRYSFVLPKENCRGN